LLVYDELRALFEKIKVQGAVLLPMVTSLFEGTEWDNRTKGKVLSVRDARLALVGCSTEDTYSQMWTSGAIAIGFPNRLFVVWAERKQKAPWPKPPDEALLAAIRNRVEKQLASLPKTFDIDPDAHVLWGEWYLNLADSVHAKRLDTIGFRLMAILALTTDKQTIDLATVENVIRILNYELTIRTQTDPIDADNMIAKLEEKIRRALRAKGPLSERVISVL